MTTPAVLYDHVPVVKKYNDNDDEQSKNGPSASILSYFVSRRIHQVSAPPEHTDWSTDLDQVDDRQPQKHSQIPILDLEQEDNIEKENDSDSAAVPMETIWEDNVCKEYLFVPYSAISEDVVVHDEYSERMVCHSSRLKNLRRIIRSLFSSNRSVCTSTFPGRPSIPSPSRSDHQDPVSHSSITQSIFLDPLIYLSSYLFSRIAISSSSSSIYKSYDWVSETVLDDTGNRLILPGALVVMDASQSDQSALDNLPFQGPQPRLFSNTDNDTSEGTLIVPHAADGESSLSAACTMWSRWPMRNTTIMVSAYDLLAIERQKKSQKYHLVTHHDLDSSPTLTSQWLLPNGDEDLDDVSYFLSSHHQRLPLALPTLNMSHTETATLLLALLKWANRRTRWWCCLSYYRMKTTAKNLGRALILLPSKHLAVLSRTSPSEPHFDSSSHGILDVADHHAEQIGRKCCVVELSRPVNVMEYPALEHIDMIEMTLLLTSDTSQDGLGTPGFD
jgi:hypothetical protein